MAWTPLRERINQLPLVLAGPILRRTQANAVTVWLALKESRSVTLEIFDTNKRRLINGSNKTVQLGMNLHVVAVTAKTSAKVLLYGENYLYDLYFGNKETLNSPGIITATGDIKEITYPQYQLPSFALPPTNLNHLRIIHGSCRKPHGESLDALAAVDKMIKEALLKDPKKRPHQLFMTGDQIYSDDVADALLFMLIDASYTLLGWSEILPDVKNTEELNPGKRNNLATNIAGLTASIGKINTIGNVAKSHLFTFGEFLFMYLFAWCDVLWVKDEDFPTFENVYLHEDKLSWGGGKLRKQRAKFQEELGYLKEFRSTLPEIRRALANIPTYMIFDDHEITDDWNLNMAWCDRILSKPLGRRVLQNGLLAYAICQAWGNTPEQFVSGPGQALLNATQGWIASGGTNSQHEQEITFRIGLPTVADITNTNPRQLPHNNNTIIWHYIVTGPGYEVIVLDTRTWRAFPGKEFDFPGLLSAEGCEAQISKILPPDGTKITLVISPGPVIGVPFLESIQKTAKSFAEKLGNAAWGFDPEAWSLESTAFERLLAALALRTLPAKGSRVIVLSGDVHYGFAARLQYSAIRPFESENVNTQVAIAQFTSSSFKNEVKGTGGSHSLHKKGFMPFEMATNLPKSEVLGWNNQAEKELEIGVLHTMVEQTFQRFPWRIKGIPTKIDLVKERGWNRVLEITKKPDWWYRIDFLTAQLENVNQPPNSHPVPPKFVIAPLPGENRLPALSEYLNMAKNYHDYQSSNGEGREIVGLNNLGEITFEFVDNKEIAVQTLWWRLESWEGKLLEPFPLTRYEVSLLFDDQQHSMDDVLKEVKL